MASPRIRRLELDHERLKGHFDGKWPLIRVADAEGTPPEKYRIEYRCRSLFLDDKGNIGERGTHILEINLHLGYPRRAPQCKMLTPVFHPNFDNASVCIGDFWAASEGLDDLVIRIGRMLTYQEYNVKSPLNGLAAKWAAENASRLPVDPQEIAPPSKTQVSDQPGASVSSRLAPDSADPWSAKVVLDQILKSDQVASEEHPAIVPQMSDQPLASVPAKAAICPICKHENPLRSKYCESCGGALFRLCPECSADIPPESRFCTNCGTDWSIFHKIISFAEQNAEIKSPRNVDSLIRLCESPELEGFVARGPKAKALGKSVTQICKTIKALASARDQVLARIRREIEVHAFGRLESLFKEYSALDSELPPDLVSVFAAISFIREAAAIDIQLVNIEAQINTGNPDEAIQVLRSIRLPQTASASYEHDSVKFLEERIADLERAALHAWRAQFMARMGEHSGRVLSQVAAKNWRAAYDTLTSFDGQFPMAFVGDQEVRAAFAKTVMLRDQIESDWRGDIEARLNAACRNSAFGIAEDMLAEIDAMPVSDSVRADERIRLGRMLKDAKITAQRTLVQAYYDSSAWDDLKRAVSVLLELDPAASDAVKLIKNGAFYQKVEALAKHAVRSYVGADHEKCVEACANLMELQKGDFNIEADEFVGPCSELKSKAEQALAKIADLRKQVEGLAQKKQWLTASSAATELSLLLPNDAETKQSVAFYQQQHRRMKTLRVILIVIVAISLCVVAGLYVFPMIQDHKLTLQSLQFWRKIS